MGCAESLHEKALADCAAIRVQPFLKVLWIHCTDWKKNSSEVNDDFSALGMCLFLIVQLFTVNSTSPSLPRLQSRVE